jgi:NAD(P)-dependent dehydrogenase (short-subunit alcohol dehydrogenase family)
MFWTQLAWTHWMREHGGSVVNLASIGGMTYGGFIGVYDTSKAALIHLTKHLATEMGPGVRVNAIAPGLVKTDMARALWEEHGDTIAKAWPLKRLGEPEDIAGAALFLASDLASWITGHVLVVDGGAVLGGFGGF